MSNPADSAPNASHLRAAIQGGEGADKVPFSDPSAAPLGTDDEAAGTPPTKAQVEMSLADETRNRSANPDANAAATTQTNAASVGPTRSRSDMSVVAPWAAVGLLIVLALGIFFGMRYLGLLA